MKGIISYNDVINFDFLWAKVSRAYSRAKVVVSRITLKTTNLWFSDVVVFRRHRITDVGR